jgi:hypothetical protein
MFNPFSIYLAGPMQSCTKEEMTGWREIAKNKLGKIFKIYDPVELETKRKFNGDAFVNAVVGGDISCIDKSDIILANLWKISTGTVMEVMHAKKNGKFVISILPRKRNWIEKIIRRIFGNGISLMFDKLMKRKREVSPWLLYHSNIVVEDFDIAVSILIDLWTGYTKFEDHRSRWWKNEEDGVFAPNIEDRLEKQRKMFKGVPICFL